MEQYTSSDHTWVVCAYKESPYLQECVSSVINQTVKTRIVITTSTPNAYVSSVAEKNGVQLIVNQRCEGIASDWNFAFDNVQTKLVTFAQQDDVYEPLYVDRMLKYINVSKWPLIFFSDYQELRNAEKIDNRKILRIKRVLLSPLKFKRNWNSLFWRRRILSLGSPICCPAVTYERCRIGLHPYSNEYKMALDWDLWERLSRKDGAFVYCPEKLVLHRIHEDSVTTRMIQNHTKDKEDLKIFNRFWPDIVARKIEKLYVKSQDSNKI